MAVDAQEHSDAEAEEVLLWSRLLRPWYLLMHLVVVALFAVTLLLGWWQWQRAEASGWSAQNISYAFQWPTLGVMGAWFYVKLMRIEAERDPDEGEPSNSLVLYRPARVDTSNDPQLAAYNAYLAELNAQVLGQDGTRSSASAD